MNKGILYIETIYLITNLRHYASFANNCVELKDCENLLYFYLQC